MQEAERLLILGAASLAASAISACFSVGGGYVLFGALTWIMPLPAAIAMQSVLSFGSLFSRTHAFWAEIDWPIVRTFTAGSLIGVGAGLWLFVRTPEGILSLLLGLML
ncbi:MAG: sulfite exporter TauE/SafE family protein, partial [Sphingomonadales bacterium]|nr:sulfite exporter TauE/SafE family protein [Sphingomonadales bacterium]